MSERLDLKVQRPTAEQVFAASQLRKLAAEFEALSELEDPPDSIGPWRRAAAKASGLASDIDGDEDSKTRVQLTEEEARAVSDLMDNRGSSGSEYYAWSTGRTGAIDWTTFELVVSTGEFAGRLQEVIIFWVSHGEWLETPLLLSVLRKLRDARESWLNSGYCGSPVYSVFGGGPDRCCLEYGHEGNCEG